MLMTVLKLHLAVIFAGLLGAALARDAFDAGKLVGFQTPTMHVKACTVVWPPFSMKNSSGGLYGYQVDLWNAVSAWLGGLNTSMTEFATLDELKQALLLPASNPKHCDVGVTRWSANTDDLGMGIRPTADTFRGGWQVVLRNTGSGAEDHWYFVKVFSWQLWLAIFLSGVGLSPFFYFSELDFYKRGLGKTRFPKEFKRGMVESTFRTYGKVINAVDELRVTSISSKAVALTWGLACTILLSIYTAGLTAKTTSANFATYITSVSDLPNKAIGVPTGATHNFIRYGWIGKEVGDFVTSSDGTKFIDALLADDSPYDAMVLDSPWLQYYLADRCDAVIVGSVFQYQHIAFALSPSIDKELSYNMTVAIVDLNLNDVQNDLTTKYFKAQSCSEAAAAEYVLSLGQMLGMWIVVAALVGMAALLVALPRINKQWDVDFLHISNSSLSMKGGGLGANAAFLASLARPSWGGDDQDKSNNSKAGLQDNNDLDDKEPSGAASPTIARSSAPGALPSGGGGKARRSSIRMSNNAGMPPTPKGVAFAADPWP